MNSLGRCKEGGICSENKGYTYLFISGVKYAELHFEAFLIGVFPLGVSFTDSLLKSHVLSNRLYLQIYFANAIWQAQKLAKGKQIWVIGRSAASKPPNPTINCVSTIVNSGSATGAGQGRAMQTQQNMGKNSTNYCSWVITRDDKKD
ncbi:hypothetical protein K1719_025587 [Acacia pycnantha]|nr:hypothetical protein K1719_025587 [Acacia pycnantha]